MRNSATLAIQGERLPPELSAVLEGIAALEAGDYLDDDEAFAEIERLIAIKSAKAGRAPRGASGRIVRKPTP